MNSTIEKIISELDLQPHPEGGYFKETYRSGGVINTESLSNDFDGERHYSTCIYFLLTPNTFSAFHRINQDEIWHFYKGAPIRLHMISKEGVYSNIIIGNDLENREVPQYVVKAKDWFAAEVMLSDSYALVGCTVSPGFDFKDFELPSRKDLIKLFPQHKQVIKRFTRV